MKTQKTNRQGRYLAAQNNRWKWMAAATAGMTASQAGAITINLVNNYISASGGNHLNTDLTGDGHPDITIANAFHSLSYFQSSGLPGYTNSNARVTLNGILASARRHDDGGRDYRNMQLGSHTASYVRSGSEVYGTLSLTGAIPIFFKDLHINGGAPTSGLLQVTVSVIDAAAKVQLDSFTYTSTTLNPTSSHTVPDQSSSLALLAIGAGGVLALRRWRAAQTHP
jgi:hypothetical protein